jgi:hypothetical protein
MRKLVGGNSGAAPWLTMIDLPAIVSMTERAASLFAEIVKLNVPDPERLPDDMLIHVGMPVADQEQVEVVPIVKLLVVPAGGAETLAGVTVNAQVPRCVTE